MSTFDAEQFDLTRPLTTTPGSQPTGISFGQPSATSPPHRPGAESGEVLFVPLAVTVGDGFKFGCGFLLASVVALLAALVVIAALFAIISFMGVNLPVGR